MAAVVEGSPRSKLASVFKAPVAAAPAAATPATYSPRTGLSPRRPVTISSSKMGTMAMPDNAEARARIMHNKQRDRLKAIMQTMGGEDGSLDTSDLLLSAKLAKIDLPEEFLLKSPYAKQYAAGWDGASPRAIKWRPFYSAIEYPKMQSKEEWTANYTASEARKAAAKAAKDKAAAEAAAAAAAAAAPAAVERPERPYVSDDELRRAHNYIKSRLTTHFADLRAAFRAVDQDGSGFVTHEEAIQSLSTLNLGIPTRIMLRIVDIADYDGDGEISFAEFARVLTSDDIMSLKDTLRASGGKVNMTDSRNVKASVARKSRIIKNGVTEDDVRHAILTMKEKLLAKYTRLDAAFKQIDEDRSGYLTRDELKFLMRMLNLDSMRPETIDVICDLMDNDGDGQVNHQEFTHLLSADDPINSGPLAAKVEAVYKLHQ